MMTTQGKKIAYIRVSTTEQNTESQKEIMNNLGIDKFFEEKVSGKDTNRPKLKEMLDFVREDDTIYVKDFSRLARSTKDLLDIIEELNAKKVNLISIKENLDTTTPAGKMMLTMLGAIYEFERANLLERQKDGIAYAKKEGKYKGRKKIAKPDNWLEVYCEWKARNITAKKACELLNLKSNTFYNFVRDSRSTLPNKRLSIVCERYDGNVEFSATQLNDGDVGTQAKPSTTGARAEERKEIA